MSGGYAGGFMPGGSQGGSPGSRKQQSNHTHRPVTIRQLLEAYQAHADAEWKIDDVELEHVTFVGNITNMGKSNTNCSCTIEDGTGSIDVRLWLETADDDSGRLEGIEENVYVRVIGNLKSFNNKRSVNATVVKPVKDLNEVQYHLLEAIRVHLYHTRGPLDQQSAAGHGQGTSRQAPAQRNGQDPYAANGNTSVSGNDYSELKPLGRKIMMHIEKVGADNLPPEGLSIESIARSIQGTTVQAIESEIDNLLGDGLLYTTTDTSHVLPTSF